MGDVKEKVVVLASGRGSNFQAIAEAIDTGKLSHLTLTALIASKPSAGALTIAQQKNIPSFTLCLQENRAQYETELKNLLLNLQPRWICLAGFLLVLGKPIVQTFPNQIINIHPSLLPKYKGLRAQKQALEAGETETGCTVHFVTEELDSGGIILQKRLPILPDDTEQSLSARLLPLEHETYVEALLLLSQMDRMGKF